jgi:hypothetical protein
VRSISAPPSYFVELGSGPASSATLIDPATGRFSSDLQHSGFANHVEGVRVRRINPNAARTLSEGSGEAREVIRFLKAVYQLGRAIVLGSMRRTLAALNVDTWIRSSSNPVARRLRPLMYKVQDTAQGRVPGPNAQADSEDESDSNFETDGSQGSASEDDETTGSLDEEEEEELDGREAAELLADISSSQPSADVPSWVRDSIRAPDEDFASVYIAHATAGPSSSSAPLTRRRYRRLSKKSSRSSPSPSSDLSLTAAIRERRLASLQSSNQGDATAGRALCSMSPEVLLLFIY